MKLNLLSSSFMPYTYMYKKIKISGKINDSTKNKKTIQNISYLHKLLKLKSEGQKLRIRKV